MAAAHPLTDHDEIRRWAEERHATPSCVRGTGGKADTGMIRLDFPGYSGREKLQEISWRDWFASFDENDLALMVQDRTARGQRSNFNKLVARKTAEGRQDSRRSGKGARSRKRAATKRTPTRSTRGSTSGARKSSRKSSRNSSRKSTTNARSSSRTGARVTRARSSSGSRRSSRKK